MIQEDARLIRQVLDGNADAYEHLVRANEKKVYNLALKMTGNEQDAMDLAQDAFLKAYTNLGKFNGTCKFSVWLYRLTYNLCVDFLRRKKRENTVPLVYEDEDGTDRSLSIRDPAGDPGGRRQAPGAVPGGAFDALRGEYELCRHCPDAEGAGGDGQVPSVPGTGHAGRDFDPAGNHQGFSSSKEQKGR